MQTKLYNTPGYSGGVFIIDTAAHAAPTGKTIGKITIVATAAIGAITDDGITGLSDLVGVSLPVGTIIEGRFSSITLASGKALALYA